MPFTLTITRTINDGGSSSTTTVTKTVEGKTSFDIVVPPATADKQVPFVVKLTSPSKLAIVSFKATGALTVEVNSPSSPSISHTLVANSAIDWTDDEPAANCPLGVADVTAIFLSNAGAANVTFSFVAGYDPTL